MLREIRHVAVRIIDVYGDASEILSIPSRKSLDLSDSRRPNGPRGLLLSRDSDQDRIRAHLVTKLVKTRHGDRAMTLPHRA